MSGFASEVFQGGLLEPGAPFLAKPFTQEDLAAKVRALLEGGLAIPLQHREADPIALAGEDDVVQLSHVVSPRPAPVRHDHLRQA